MDSEVKIKCNCNARVCTQTAGHFYQPAIAAGLRGFDGIWRLMFAWSELASAGWLALVSEDNHDRRGLRGRPQYAVEFEPSVQSTAFKDAQ